MKQSTPTSNSSSACAQLFIGPEQALIDKTHHFLHTQLCKQTSCVSCPMKTAIDKHQHHALRWINPEKTYTLDMLDTVRATLSLALDPGQKLFIVLQSADRLGSSCANALLKSIEEPPQGYHFVLLAQRAEDVLPTIRSRCHITHTHGKELTVTHETLFQHFINKKKSDPASFLRELDRAKLNEREAFELTDTLLAHYISIFEKDHAQVQHVVTMLQNEIEHPIMPGSSKIFLKNLYLHLHLQSNHRP